MFPEDFVEDLFFQGFWLEAFVELQALQLVHSFMRYDENPGQKQALPKLTILLLAKKCPQFRKLIRLKIKISFQILHHFQQLVNLLFLIPIILSLLFLNLALQYIAQNSKNYEKRIVIKFYFVFPTFCKNIVCERKIEYNGLVIFLFADQIDYFVRDFLDVAKFEGFFHSEKLRKYLYLVTVCGQSQFNEIEQLFDKFGFLLGCILHDAPEKVVEEGFIYLFSEFL